MREIKFCKSAGNPIIPRKYNTFHSIHVANPDIIEMGEKYFMYFRGQDKEACDQLGLAFCEKNNFDGIHWNFHPANPIIRVDQTQDTFDNQHILDPAAIKTDGKVYLYYAGHSKERKFGIGLAISEDGIVFKKYSDKPLVAGALSPEIVFYNDSFYLFYSRLCENGNLDIYVCRSIDGINFNTKDEVKVFSPTGNKNDFDGFSISTVRIFKENGYFYMIYGGCDKYFDYPKAFGLARSKDLIKWERYPKNPVLSRGEEGDWDEGAVWFGTTIKHNGAFHLFYEGVGAGLGVISPEGKECSEICRNEDYGGYRKFSFSQIGTAVYNGSLEW